MNKSASRGKPVPDNLIVGRQPVLEALRYGRPLKVYLAHGQRGEPVEAILSLSRQKGVPLFRVSREELHSLARGLDNHQGVVALALPFRYLSLEQVIQESKKASPAPFLVLLDHLQDPQNLGSIIRTAEAAAVHGIVIPERRAAGVTPAVRKVAAGAVERVRLCRVKNLVQAIIALKKEGFWIYGAEADGESPFYTVDYTLPLALVLGSEGKGLSPLARRHCDRVVSIPMAGDTGSLNVAVTAAVLLFTACGQRRGWFT